MADDLPAVGNGWATEVLSVRAWRLTRRTVVLGVLIVVALAAPARATNITEFPLIVAHSGPRGIAAGPDGNLWFTEFAGSRFGRITPSGAVKDWSTGSGISAGSQPFGIASGPDGSLWFAENAGNRVGRIAPTAAPMATEFSIGITAGGAPMEVATGPDGNVWFSELNGRIGRITTAGTVTEFSSGIIPTCAVWGIAGGPDGNLWFTQQHGCDRVGRITPTGSINEYSIGISPDSAPQDITTGPDGNLWFTEFTGDRVARITTTGTVTEFTAGISPLSEPTGITTGPDGNLWFTEGAGNRIARITPTGSVTEFSSGLSPDSRPEAITMGPDFNLWFTEYAGNRIGRLILDPRASTGTAGSIRSTSASLAGTVSAFGAQTSYVFEYGRTTAYGTATNSQILRPGAKPTVVTASLIGLKPQTVYRYRLVASSVAGTSTGTERTFTTGTGGGGGGGGGGRTGKRKGPTMTISSRLLTATRSGFVRIRIRCPLSETLGCHGSLAVETANKVTVRKSGAKVRRKLRLGTARFRIGGGQIRTVTFALSRKSQALIRRFKHLRIKVIVTAFDSSGNRARTVKLLSLRSQTR
jgi:streptogramin lyase